MAGTITPKGWESFQHYKDRKPAWIKLHRDLLDNYDFHCLPVASRALAPCLWLLASEYEGGHIPADFGMIAFRLRMEPKDVQQAVSALIDKGFFVASNLLADCKQSAMLEKEKEKEKELGASTRKGSRLPADWVLTDEFRSAAVDTRPDWPAGYVETVAGSFRDYWVAQPGAKGVKLDWVATWRNWCRNDRGRPVGVPQSQSSQPARQRVMLSDKIGGES